MKLILESIIDHPEGVSDVSVIIVNQEKKKSYTFFIGSKKVVSDFRWLLNKRFYGEALNLLKKENIRNETKILVDQRKV